jgi:hypothetical protein
MLLRRQTILCLFKDALSTGTMKIFVQKGWKSKE